MRSIRLLIAVLLAGASAAQELRPLPSQGPFATAVVPVVGNLFGETMVRWITDVEVVNETGLPVDVAIELPIAPESPAIFLTLGPGQSQRFPDIVGQAFGLESALSPLRVTTSALRSVSVSTNVFALRGAEISARQQIPADLGRSFYSTRVLDDLAFSDDQRTNIGLVNLSDSDADFLLALQRIPGRSMAITHLRLGPSSILHQSIQSLFPLITRGTGFSVVVETLATDTYVYASVIDSASGEARFVSGRVGVR